MLFFDFNKWIKCNNVVVHCKTLEEATDFINVLKENNWKDEIKDASEYSKYIERWNKYQEDTCYNLNNGCFADYDYYSFYEEYTILEWSDYMLPTTPKSILQEHDIVITRNHEGYMYYANQNIFVNSRGYNLVSDYDEDLIIMTLKEDEDDICEFDIMQILRPYYPHEFVEINWEDAKVIWKRPEAVEMTLEEVCGALGKNVKIVKSKK